MKNTNKQPIEEKTMSYRAFAPLLFLLALAACKDGEPVEVKPVIRPVKVQQVFSTGGKRLRTFAGSARAGLASRLSFRVPGTIQELPVKLGDRVAKGRLIARLDDGDYQLQVDDAEASLRQAEAQRRNAEANHARIRGLYENNNVSINEFDASRAAKESASAQVQSITKKLELARSQLSYTELKAPLAGYIAELKAERNENVAAGQAVAVLNAGARPEVTFAIPELLIAHVRDGDAVKIQFGALAGRTFEATVTEVGLASGGMATTYPVVVRLNEPNSEIRQGMAAEVAMIFGESDDRARIYVMPKAVVEDQEGQTFVFLANANEEGTATVTRKNVDTGELTSDGLEISAGLEEGSLVITHGLRFLSEGMIVKLPEQAKE